MRRCHKNKFCKILKIYVGLRLLKTNFQHSFIEELSNLQQEETVAVIGPDTSDLARAVADFAGLFRVPVISPAATSPLLGDRSRFKYFLRTVPSDSFQVEAILNIITYFHWNYIMLLVSDDEYGRSARMEFKKQVESSDKSVCLVIDEIVNSGNREKVIRKIKNEKKSKVVVLISNLNEAHLTTHLAYEEGLSNVTWIASDAWNKNTFVTSGKELMFKGMLGVSPVSSKVEGFQQYLAEILSTDKKEGWSQEFYEYETNYTCVNRSIARCVLDDHYEMPPYQIASTVNAVLATGHALHKLFECNETRCKRDVKNAEWSLLLYHLQNITFLGTNNKTILFNDKGGEDVGYKLWNLQQKKDEYHFEDVGLWTDGNMEGDKFLIYKRPIQWNTNVSSAPKSICSQPCVPGIYRRLSYLFLPVCSKHCIRS